MTLKECMKKKKPYMVHEEAIGGVDGCPSSQPFLHCEKGLCEQDDKGRGSTWTSLCTYCWNQPMPAPDDMPKQCCRCNIKGERIMKDYIETQYKNLDFEIPDDFISRREVYAMLDYIGGADADEAFYQGWDAAIDEACSLLNDVDSAIGWTSVEEEPPEESGTLLVTRYNKLTGFREVCVAQYWAVDKRFVVMRAGDVGIDLLDDVVAWMPFPKAYGGKSDE